MSSINQRFQIFWCTKTATWCKEIGNMVPVMNNKTFNNGALLVSKWKMYHFKIKKMG
jgi:hypothetical protein